MKKALAIVLCLCLLTQCIARLGVMGWYQLHKDYIARTLCINRDKPAMKCCGKCYLRKQLKKVDDTDASKKQSGRIDKSEALVYILPQIVAPATPFLTPEPAVQHPVLHNLYDSDLTRSVFHPPAGMI